MGEEQRKRKIIVGVHGIGDQVRNETIQAIVRQFCKHYGASGAVPLGRYHSAFSPKPGTVTPRVFFPEGPSDPPLQAKLDFTIGFAEVYWADIPRRIVSRGYTLEQATTWANSIVERLRVRHKEAGKGGEPIPDGWKKRLLRPELTDTDYVAIKAILAELIETLTVLERLTFLADKAGLFSFDLRKLLDDFLGDVQTVTEFDHYRSQILDRFREVMRGAHQVDPQAEIYLIAHSEGTVISFLGLLEALSTGSRQEDWEWLQQVRGFMTIGSPIDKHIVLWPKLWNDVSGNGWRAFPANTIRWRNYYDFGDPVGYELDTARSWLTRNGVACFEFLKDDDFGFSRYPLPGKAHIDYWDDQEVFGHFIGEVVDVEVGHEGKPEGKPGPTKPHRPPTSRRWVSLVSNLVPYLLVAALLCGAVYLLHKSVDNCLEACKPAYDCLKVILSPPLPPPITGNSATEFFTSVFCLTFLLAGLSVASRLPRLTRRWPFYVLSVGFFAVCSYAATVISGRTIQNLGNLLCQFASHLPAGISGMVTNCDPAVLLHATTFGILILSWLVKPTWGKKTLLLSGSAVAAVMVGTIVFGSSSHGGVWPVVVALLLFFYLWWLAILLFDIVFTWHRYIRSSNVVTHLCTLYERSGTRGSGDSTRL